MEEKEDTSIGSLTERVESLKGEKRKLKATRQLNESAARVSNAVAEGPEGDEIKAAFERLEGLKEKTLDKLEELRELYKVQKNLEKQVKVGDEADELNEKIEREAEAARQILTTATPSTTLSVSPVHSANSNPHFRARSGDNGLRNL